MSAQSLEKPYQMFFDKLGKPLESGTLRIGTAGNDPYGTGNEKTVYWDAALSTAATQPISVIGGYPMNSGVPGQLYVDGDHSITVKNHQNALVYSELNCTKRVDSAFVTYKNSLTGAVVTTAFAKLNSWVSVKDFGATGDGSTDDTAAIDLALTASDTVYFPPGRYMTTGGHNIQNKAIIGHSRYVSRISLSGTNTNTNIFGNDGTSSTTWGTGGGCLVRDLWIEGNWDGSTVNSETTLADIGAIIKWYGGAYVKIENCLFASSFGFGVFCYRLGYSWIKDCEIKDSGFNGVHWEGVSGSDAITSSIIENCSIHGSGGTATSTTLGGNGIAITEGFQVGIKSCTLESLRNGVRVGGSDNRSIYLSGCHLETCTNAGVDLQGAGTQFGFYFNNFSTTTNLIQASASTQDYIAIGNYTMEDVYQLERVTDGPNVVAVNNATPQVTIAEVSLSPGFWLITGTWNGVTSTGTGQADAAQQYAINSSEAIPGYSSAWDRALFNTELASDPDAFNCAASTLTLPVRLTSTTTFYLYGGPTGITSSLVGSVVGTLQAIKVDYQYPA